MKKFFIGMFAVVVLGLGVLGVSNNVKSNEVAQVTIENVDALAGLDREPPKGLSYMAPCRPYGTYYGCWSQKDAPECHVINCENTGPWGIN